MMRWDKITVNKKKVVDKGLINRRMSEVAQWNSMSASCDPCGTRPSEPKGRPVLSLMASSRQTQAGATATGAGALSLVKDKFGDVSEVMSYLPEIASYSGYILVCVGLFVVARRYIDSRNGRAY